MKHLKYYLLPVVAVFAAGMSSCNDNDTYFEEDAQNSPIKVTQIYLENHESAVPDRPVDFARLGQLIRIEGEGLYGVRKVYINGYDTYFNRAFVSDNSMLISVHADTPISDCDPELRDKIRLVKDGSEYTFDLTIRAASPTVTSVSNTLPKPGETVTVYGSGFQETTEITLPGGVKVTTGIECDNEDGEWFSFVMPTGVTEGGSIEAVNANGVAKTPAYFNERRGMILDCDGTGAFGSWSATYDPENDIADDPTGSGRGKCIPAIPASALPIKASSQGSAWFTAGNDEPSDDWTHMYDLIPWNTPTSEIAFQFDVYCPEELSTGVLEFTLQNNLSNYGFGTSETSADYEGAYAVCWVPWMQDGEFVPFKTDGWVTVTIPLTTVGKYQDLKAGYLFQDVVAHRNAASYRNFGMFFVNKDVEYTDGNTYVSTPFNQGLYVDNWRIVPFKQYTVSDFPDEDEEETDTPAEN